LQALLFGELMKTILFFAGYTATWFFAGVAIQVAAYLT
jgi:hypothetical protein